jgi:hypothetical protein
MDSWLTCLERRLLVKTGSKCICAVCRQQEPMQELGAFPFQKAVRARSVVCGDWRRAWWWCVIVCQKASRMELTGTHSMASSQPAGLSWHVAMRFVCCQLAIPTLASLSRRCVPVLHCAPTPRFHFCTVRAALSEMPLRHGPLLNAHRKDFFTQRDSCPAHGSFKFRFSHPFQVSRGWTLTR